jgi:hypothetical protein
MRLLQCDPHHLHLVVSVSGILPHALHRKIMTTMKSKALHLDADYMGL